MVAFVPDIVSCKWRREINFCRGEKYKLLARRV